MLQLISRFKETPGGPPIGKLGELMRNRYLETLSLRIAEISSPSIVCGDFNATPWSSIFQKFIKFSGLLFAENHLVPNSWPTTYLIPGLPIDHCLSKGLNIVRYKKGPDINSDHWPLVIQIASKNRNIASEK